MSSSIITGDVVHVISEYLDPLDVVNLYRAVGRRSRYNYYSMFERAVLKKIDDWFRGYFGNRYAEFRDSMIKSKAVVSGFFILQMILDERWISDIDIFFDSSCKTIQAPNCSRLVSSIEKFLYSDHEYDDNKHLRDTYDVIFHDSSTGFGVRNYRIPNQDFTYFQTIAVRTRNCEIVQVLCKHIDFDICKNAFWYDDAGYHIYIHSPSQIVNRRFKGETKYITRLKSIDRREKYESRGFNHSN